MKSVMKSDESIWLSVGFKRDYLNEVDIMIHWEKQAEADCFQGSKEKTSLKHFDNACDL